MLLLGGEKQDRLGLKQLLGLKVKFQRELERFLLMFWIKESNLASEAFQAKRAIC